MVSVTETAARVARWSLFLDCRGDLFERRGTLRYRMWRSWHHPRATSAPARRPARRFTSVEKACVRKQKPTDEGSATSLPAPVVSTSMPSRPRWATSTEPRCERCASVQDAESASFALTCVECRMIEPDGVLPQATRRTTWEHLGRTSRQARLARGAESRLCLSPRPAH